MDFRPFVAFAGIRNSGDIDKSLGAISKGKEALIEKVGSKYRFRSRYARLWFALRRYQIQGLIPAMRLPERGAVQSDKDAIRIKNDEFYGRQCDLTDNEVKTKDGT